ncbi:MAG TPA: glucosamine 6-phosphate synthetase [bacterium]|nr:glucosamine 6-phosphate synthetase [bacterium]
MCGLTGVVLQAKRRRKTERNEIGRVFTDLLLLNQARGKDAAGLAMIRRDGSYSLFKRPGPAEKLILEEKYAEVIGRLDNKTTCILGHTRLKTRGTEANSLNNHPIRAGAVIGAAAGTILNADALFRKFRLPRRAEVDSEFIFRLADRKESIEDFTACLRNVRGGMSAVFTRTSAPDTVLVIKGNKPLTLWYHNGFRAVFYSSEEWPLEEVIGNSADVVPLDVAPFTLSVFQTDDLLDFHQHDVQFITRNWSARSWMSLSYSSMEL